MNYFWVNFRFKTACFWTLHGEDKVMYVFVLSSCLRGPLSLTLPGKWWTHSCLCFSVCFIHPYFIFSSFWGVPLASLSSISASHFSTVWLLSLLTSLCFFICQWWDDIQCLWAERIALTPVRSRCIFRPSWKSTVRSTSEPGKANNSTIHASNY